MTQRIAPVTDGTAIWRGQRHEVGSDLPINGGLHIF